MSDSGRWDFGDRAEAKLKPDSEKSTWEHVSDKFKGTADNAAPAFGRIQYSQLQKYRLVFLYFAGYMYVTSQDLHHSRACKQWPDDIIK